MSEKQDLEVTTAKFEVADFKMKSGEVHPGALIEVEGKEHPAPFFGIKEATLLLKKSYPQYVRTLLLGGKLDKPIRAVKVQLEGFQKWFIALESLHYYEANKKPRSEWRRFILRLPNLGDQAKAEKALKAAGIEYQLEVAYQAKPKGKSKSKPKAKAKPARIIEL